MDSIVSTQRCDIRLALVQFRDHPPEEKSFVTRSHNFTHNHDDMREWLCKARAFGGGDTPEAIADGLRDVLRKLTWRVQATKVCVLVTDTIPHGLCPDLDSSFADGNITFSFLFQHDCINV